MDLKAELAKLFHVPKRRAGGPKKSPAKPREDPSKKTKAKDQSVILREINICNDPLTILKIAAGDITQDTSTAIVCPANNFLDFNGGVAAAIVAKGG